MTRNDFLDVYYEDRYAGTLAETPAGKIAFSYGEEWLRGGFSLSPFSLPLRKGVFVHGRSHGDALWGVFRDSLGADGQAGGQAAGEEGSLLDRLTAARPHVSEQPGMLTYCRAKRPGKEPLPIEGAETAETAEDAAETEMQRDYRTVAGECGIRTSAKPGFNITAAALLERDPMDTDWDYTDFMKLTKIMTDGNLQETMEMYRRMCFNVFARNEEDHAGTQAFLYDEARSKWILAPMLPTGYALLEEGHMTSVRGHRHTAGMDDLLSVGMIAGLPRRLAEDIADEVRDKTSFLVARWRG